MPEHALLRELILAYAIALLFIVALARLRVPPVVALIVAGIVAGPAGLGIARTQEEVDALAEIGVVLLLFTVGLDFSLTEIRRIWRPVVLGGAGQLAGTAAAVLALLVATAAMPWRAGLFIGLFVALSSTAIVLKELGLRNELSSPYGRLTVGVLLFQDLSLIVLLLVVPILSGRSALEEAPMLLLRAGLALAAVALGSRVVLPPLLRIVIRSGRREAFSLAVLLASIGTAWVSSLLGLSTAVGAFLGGLMLAESEFSHQAHHEIRPLRDVLAGLFFISLGMLVDPARLLHDLPLVLAVTAGIVLLKAPVAAGALLAAGIPLRVALTAGLGLAQIGEFSFILGRTGVESGLLTPALWQTLLSASILTMVITPGVVAVAPRAAFWILEKTGRRQELPETPARTGHLDHVVILGFGVGGQLLARALRSLGVPYVVMDLNGSTVQQAAARGEPIVYGDASNADALQAAGVERARAVVVVLSDPRATTRVVATVRSFAPAVPIVVRTRYRMEAAEIAQLGATVVVAEELEASLEVLAQLLARLGVPDNVSDAMLDGFRETATMRPVHAPRSALDTLPQEVVQTPVATHQLEAGDWAVGRTLADVDLRAATGTSVLAVRHGSQYVASPGADLTFDAGDLLYLLGRDADIRAARERLTVGLPARS